MKSILSCFLCTLLILATLPLISCFPQESPDDTSLTTSAVQSTESHATEENFKLESLTIDGVSIADFQIVYAQSEFYSVRRRITTEYDFWKLIAEDVAQQMNRLTGVTLSISKDTKTEQTAHEILIGPTNRSASDYLSKLDVYQYQIQVTDGNLILGGGYDGSKYNSRTKDSIVYASTYHAFDHLEEYLKECGSSSVDLPADFSLSGVQEIRTIACIGDSITEGYLSTDWNIDSYPAVLQRLLWKDSFVINLGNSGRTMRSDLAGQYQATSQYSAAIRYPKYFDYVLIMLGTNDSDQDAIWSAADDEQFLSDGQAMVEKIGKKNSDIQFFILNCPAYYGTGNSGSKHVRELQEKLVTRLNDQTEYKVSFYDMHQFTSENLGASHYPDALHPDNEGYAMMAEGISELITTFEAGNYSYILPITSKSTQDTSIEKPELTAGSSLLTPIDLSESYPMDSTNTYSSWYFPNAPYLYTVNYFEGKTITDIEIPISSCEKGDYLTVSVVKYDSKITETKATYRCQVTYSQENSGWIRITDLNISVPEGYTLAFGKSSDSLKVCYLTSSTSNHPSGYDFYISALGQKSGGDILAFNVYGK
jgi:lysophospholipase L1-like esterase